MYVLIKLCIMNFVVHCYTHDPLVCRKIVCGAKEVEERNTAIDHACFASFQPQHILCFKCLHPTAMQNYSSSARIVQPTLYLARGRKRDKERMREIKRSREWGGSELPSY